MRSSGVSAFDLPKPSHRLLRKGGKEMIRLIAVAGFALAIATSAHAITLAPLHQSDNMITQVREACGAGMHMSMVFAGRPPPAVRPVGAWCGVQGTFAVSGV